MSKLQVANAQLRTLLSNSGARLINADVEDFDQVLVETLQAASELEGLTFAAVLCGSLREGSCCWARSGEGAAFCDELHEALFDRAADRIAEEPVIVMDAPSGFAERLGGSSVLIFRLGDLDESEGLLVLAAEAGRDWSEEVRGLFVMFGSVISGMAHRERDDAERLSVDSELQRSRNLGAISKLSGGIAHDINDMLVPIIGHTEAMIAAGASDPGLKSILASATGAADLTKQLLAFSQKQMLVKKTTDVADCIGGMRDTLQRVLGEGIEIVERAPEAPWCVQADRGQFEQVVMNLCTNARDAMDGKGRVELSVDNVATGQGGEGYMSGDFVRLRVRDFGCGIARECFDHVFEPFRTTKGRGGAGLGLSVAQGIVEQHGGWMDLESEIGKGSTFSVFLPADRAAVPDRGASPRCGKRLETARVLLVDDEPSVVNFIKQVLVSKAYAVTTAGSRAEAFEILNSSSEGFDLLFTDAMLPDGTGMDVVQRGRSIDPEVSALLSSGYSDDRSLLARAEAEDVDFLAKPYSLEDLQEAVENALGAELAS